LLMDENLSSVRYTKVETILAEDCRG
jgi:hypothetical protein